MKRLYLLAIAIATALLSLTSCVHEWPEPPATRDVRLTVRHELPWTLFDFLVQTRGRGDIGSVDAVRYIFEVYPAGSTERPVSRFTLTRDDMSLADFTTDIPLPQGEWDIYVWSDFAESGSGLSPHYDASSFSSVKALMPYRGGTSLKDAFQGKFQASVPPTTAEAVDVECEVTLRRPLTAYAFLSTDLHEFIDQETRRNAPDSTPEDSPGIPGLIDFNRYRARFTYTGYLPVEYSVLRNRPVDSASGLSFEGEIKVVNSDEVLVGFDYFLINGAESTISVALEIFDETGALVSSTPSFIIPVQRNRATIVRGNFLTSQTHGGIGVNPDFDGEFNIEIR